MAEHAEGGVVGGGFFFVVVGGVGDGHAHVGLAGAEPDFAEEDVGDGEGVAGLDGEGEGVGGLEGVEFDAPFAGGVGGGGLGLAGDGDGDFFAGVGPTPDGDGRAALQDHVVGEDGGEADVGVGGGGDGTGEEDREGGEESMGFHKVRRF